MCGVWLAMEDIGEEAEPLLYYPGSHKWPIVANEMLGRAVVSETGAQEPYEPIWRELVNASGIPKETFCARKGQALIWTANLLHGGCKQNDLTLTRWSQVTHYYFENCSYYTPAYSLSSLGQLHLRHIEDIGTGDTVHNVYRNEPIETPVLDAASKLTGLGALIGRLWQRHRSSGVATGDLPEDFDSQRYYSLNPDVARSGQDAKKHYLHYGQPEQRRYR